MALFKGLNTNLVYFLFGLLIGFCFSLFISVSHAAEIDNNNFNNGMFEALDEVYAPNSVIVYDPNNDIYNLITFTDNASFGSYQDKKTLFFNNPAWETGLYYYDLDSKSWVKTSELVTQYSFNDNSYIVYSSKNINYENKEGVYFYKTSSTITNKYYHSVNTVLMQKIPEALKILVPVGLIIMSLFIGVGLIPKIIYKFV